MTIYGFPAALGPAGQGPRFYSLVIDIEPGPC